MLGSFEGALEDLNRADQLEPNNAFTLQFRGETKRLLNDYKGALEDLNRADQLEPTNAVTLQNRGETKRMLGDLKGALKDLNRANELEPNNSVTLQSRGETKRMLGDLNGALGDLNRAHELEPNNVFTLQSRGETKRLLGDYTGAYVDFVLHDELVANNAQLLEQKNLVKQAIMKGIPLTEIKIISVLGKGGCGEVFLAEWNGQLVALKKPLGIDNDKFIHEVMTLMKFCDANIVTSFGFCGGNNEMSFIMEYADGGSLYDLLHKQMVELDYNKILSYACDVASGLACLHNRRFLHRDLKSANVLLFEGGIRVKIADFGHSRTLHERSHASSIVGTINYIAPEVLAEQPYYTSADVYSFGVLLYEMCTNKTLPVLEEHSRMTRIKDNIKYPGLCELIMMCCRTESMYRPTIQECLDILKFYSSHFDYIEL